jgi:LPXTG-motif cell wall-anchored protein
LLASGCSLAGVAALAAVLTAPPAVAEQGPAGSAYALSVETTLLDAPLVRIDPRPTAAYPRGGRDSLAKVGPDAAGLVTANALNASAALKGRVLASRASIAEVVVTNVLRATVVSAECTAGPHGLTGRSSVADLRVLGQPLDVTSPGEFDVLGVAKVRIGEQIRSGGTLTVNAVHVIVDGPAGGVTSADIVLSQAKCAWHGKVQPSTPPSTPQTPPASTTTAPTLPPTSTSPGAGGPGAPPSTTTTTSTRTTTRGIAKTSNDDGDLAETGASGILPISLAGLLLLAGGGATLLVTRRKRAAGSSSES